MKKLLCVVVKPNSKDKMFESLCNYFKTLLTNIKRFYEPTSYFYTGDGNIQEKPPTSAELAREFVPNFKWLKHYLKKLPLFDKVLIFTNDQSAKSIFTNAIISGFNVNLNELLDLLNNDCIYLTFFFQFTLFNLYLFYFILFYTHSYSLVIFVLPI